MPAPTLSSAPPAPLRSQSPAVFTSLAEAFVDWWADFPDELNDWAEYWNTFVPGEGVPAGPVTASGLTMATSRILGRVTASTGAVEELTAAQVKTLLAIAVGDVTGTWTDQLSGFIASPSDKSYIVALKMAFAGTITEVTTKSASGTCTATWKINSTALGGTANSVSSSETSQSHSSSNAFVAGDDLVLTVSANSTCADMSFTIKYTRTLA